MSKVFVDTNIWLYSFIKTLDEAKNKAAQSVFAGNDSIIISVQVINEVCVNLIKKANFKEEYVKKLIESFYIKYTVHDITKTVLLRASSLREEKQFSFWDSLIISSAIESGCSTLYSEDMQDGLIINDSLKIINPLPL
jgi:predicted nucleic acid-binding protein